MRHTSAKGKQVRNAAHAEQLADNKGMPTLAAEKKLGPTTMACCRAAGTNNRGLTQGLTVDSVVVRADKVISVVCTERNTVADQPPGDRGQGRVDQVLEEDVGGVFRLHDADL